MSQIDVTPEFLQVCQKIMQFQSQGRNWDATESIVEFQDGPFCGGWDSHEHKFIFSYYLNESECCLMLSLDEVKGIADGTVKTISIQTG